VKDIEGRLGRTRWSWRFTKHRKQRSLLLPTKLGCTPLWTVAVSADLKLVYLEKWAAAHLWLAPQGRLSTAGMALGLSWSS